MLYKQSDILFPLLIIVGIVLGVFYILKKINKLNLEKAIYTRLIVVMSYSGISFYVGARFFDDLFHFLNGEPWGQGGITFLGGMVCAMVVFIVLYLIFLKPIRHLFFKILNIVACGIILGHAIGRIGCFCAGCCFGEITTSMLGVHFPGDYSIGTKGYIIGDASDGYHTLFEMKLQEYGYSFNSLFNDSMGRYVFDQAKNFAENTKLLPTQLIETAFLLCLFGFLQVIGKYEFPLYVILYGIYRFLIEYLRFDNRGATSFGISPSQLMSILIVVGGVILFGLYIYLHKKKNYEI